MVHFISRSIFILVSKILLGREVYGRENIPKRGGFILASNHVSFIDPAVVGSSSPRQMKYMARDSLFCNRFAAWWLNAVGCFPVKRDSADLSAMKQAMRYVREGYGLLLFPEGRRCEEGEIVQAHAGIGFLAARLNVPVIPAFINGSRKALPKGAKFIRPAKVKVYYGKQIRIERGKDYQEIANDIMNSIRELKKDSLK